jgi:hypothetical protein
MALACEQEGAPGSQITVAFSLPPAKEVMRARALVVWSKPREGDSVWGLHFQGLHHTFAVVIERYVREYLREVARDRRKGAPISESWKRAHRRMQRDRKEPTEESPYSVDRSELGSLFRSAIRFLKRK